MKCPTCQHDNPERARFCLECGAAFAARCVNCAAELPAAAKFCLECGTAQARSVQSNVAAADQSPATRDPRIRIPPHLADKILASKSELEDERKIITVVFADLKGSTALIEGMDPEAASAVIDPALGGAFDS